MAEETGTVHKQKRSRKRNPQRRGIWLPAAVLAIVIVAAIAWMAVPRQASPVQTPAQQGDSAVVPDFAVQTLDGSTFRLSDHRGRVVAIYAMAGWCFTCIPEARAWARLYPEYHRRGLDVLVLSVDPTETPGSLARFWELAGGEVSSLPWAIDRDQEVTRLLEVKTLDQTIVVDREGRLAYVDYRPTSVDELRTVLEHVLGEEQ